MNRYTLAPRQGQGRGYLSRYGRAMAFWVADGAISAAMSGWCRLVGDRPAKEVLDDLERLALAPGVVAVCALVLDDGDVTALLYGGVPLYADRGESREAVPNAPGQPPVVLSLGDVSTVDLDPGSVTTDVLLDLEQGAVAADGFVLRRVAASATPWDAAVGAPADSLPPPPYGPLDQPTAPLPAADEPQRARAGGAVISLHDDADDLPALQPLPVASAHQEARPESGEVEVHGLRCSRDHFNDPRARFCHACGIAMHQDSFRLTTDVRPPLGVLVFGDGSYQQVGRALVFGREPDGDARVRSGEAIAVTLTDPRSTISRVHAEVAAVDWDVHVVDRGSTNGTFVWAPGAQHWERLAPHQARVLDPGAHVAFGRLTARFETALRPA